MLSLVPHVVLILAVLLSLGLVFLYWGRGWTKGHSAAVSVMAWIRSGMAGLGRVGSARTSGQGLLSVPLQYEDARMRNASATVLFGERGEAREVVLRCDLERPPRRDVLIGSTRWGLCSRALKAGETLAPWHLRQVGLFALTSERRLVDQYREVLHSLMESAWDGVAYLELDRASPHLTLTLNLESGSSLPSPAPFFNLLRRLAETVPQPSR